MVSKTSTTIQGTPPTVPHGAAISVLTISTSGEESSSIGEGRSAISPTLNSAVVESSGKDTASFHTIATLLPSLSSTPSLQFSSTNDERTANVAAVSVSASSTPVSVSPTTSTVSSSSSDDPDANPRVSTPVAMIAGILAGSIAVLAAIMVACVVSRRRKGKLRARRTPVVRNFEEQIDAGADYGSNTEDEEEVVEEAGRHHRARTGSSLDSQRRQSPRQSFRHHSSREYNSGRGSRHTASRTKKVPVEVMEMPDLQNLKLPSSAAQVRASASSPPRSSRQRSSPPTASPTSLASAELPVPLPSFSATNTRTNHTNHIPRPDPHTSPLPLPSSFAQPKSKAEDAEDLPPAYDDVR
ncbi:hypothetical protein CPC08DRAFT_767021 [Agrocybe pediades]|nr:hypothetical protein CPC08DRAFT_767021 [Agrocybe pediades]